MTISRRRFIPLAGGALAAAAFSQQTRGTHGLPVGIQLYMVNAELTKDPAGTLKKLAEIRASLVYKVGRTPKGSHSHTGLSNAG